MMSKQAVQATVNFVNEKDMIGSNNTCQSWNQVKQAFGSVRFSRLIKITGGLTIHF